MNEHSVPGGARVSRRALVDIIRPAVAGSYGVTGFVARSTAERMLGWLHLADPGIKVSTRRGLTIDLHLTVAFGLPVAEVARQADSAVRYALRRALGRDIDRLTIHVGGMRYAGEMRSSGDQHVSSRSTPWDPSAAQAAEAGNGKRNGLGLVHAADGDGDGLAQLRAALGAPTEEAG